MARREKKTIAPDVGTVVITCHGVRRYDGRYTAGVTEVEDGILVWRKRDRGGQYDRHFFPWKRVFSYCEGVGDRKSEAHAVVMDFTEVVRVTGTIEYGPMAGGVTVTDKEGNVHVIAGNDDPSLTMRIMYSAEKPDAATSEADDVRAPRVRTRRAKEQAEPRAARASARPHPDDEPEDLDEVDEGPEDEFDEGDEVEAPEDLAPFDEEDEPEPAPAPARRTRDGAPPVRTRTRREPEPEPVRTRRSREDAEPPVRTRARREPEPAPTRSRTRAPDPAPATRKRGAVDNAWTDN